MKIANILLAPTLCLGLILTVTSVRAFDNYKEFKRDAWDFEAGTNYYRTESNYGSGGQNEKLINGGSFQLIDFRLASRYFYGKNTSAYLVGNIGASESKDGTATRTNSAFNQVILGADYLAYSESFDLVPEVSLVVPTDKVSTTNGDNVMNSEGVMELRPRVTLQKDWNSFGAYTYTGFTFRDEGRSFLLPWGFGAFTKFSNSRLGAEIFGYQSITDDKDTKSKTARLTFLGRADGGSYKFASFNPSLIDTNFFYHTGLSGPWSFEVDGGISVTGANAANGIHVGALIRYSFDMTKGYTEEPRYHTPVELPRGRAGGQRAEPPAPKSDSFAEDVDDGVDQRIFRPRPTKKPRPPEEAPLPRLRTERSSKSRARPNTNDQQLQQQLDDTEMQIELKANGKKKRKKKH